MSKIPHECNVPARYRDPWERPTDPDWVLKFSTCNEIINQKGMLVLIGDRGTGKTRMAAELMRERVPARMHYDTAMGIFLRIRQSYAKKGEDTELKIVESLVTTRLLVIDEIQERSNSEWEDRILTHVMDRRYGETRPTIIIGNLTAQSIAENLGESVVSRIQETGGIVKMTGKSHRMKSSDTPPPKQPKP
jgi:DNA replication protein DnaC